MPPIITIARLTILEASRRRLLLALGVLTVVVIALTSWGFSRLPTMKGVTPAEVRLAASQLTILVAFMFSGVLALGSTLVAAPTVASDIESGIALAILPRPIRRSELLMGKWLGLAALVILYAAGSGLLELLGIWLATGYTPPHPILTLLFVAAEGIVLMSLALLLSTRLSPMTGGVIALVLFFVAWIGGIALAVGQAFSNDTIINIGLGSRLLIPTDGLWHGAIFNLEPAQVLNLAKAAGRARAGNPFLAEDPLPAAYLAWCVAWVIAVLGVANWSFARRDL
ncbi:MAG TPA: ABC transporter permease [Candidatus Dormibacteraeota bacterium]|jgi:ABC-type transport system involved in multi-copper enzyme maturation permease subunit